MGRRSRWETLLGHLRRVLDEEQCEDALRDLLQDEQPADIALAMEELEEQDAQRVFAALGDHAAPPVLSMVGPDLARKVANMFEAPALARMVAAMPDRDAAALLADQPRAASRASVARGAVSLNVAREASNRGRWADGSAGRLMTERFLKLPPETRCGEAVEAWRRLQAGGDAPGTICVVREDPEDSGARDRLLGVLSIRDALLRPRDRAIGDVMATDPVSVAPGTHDTDAARLLSKHKFSALPVTGRNQELIGLIPAEDLMQVTLARLHSRYTKAVGADAAAMERMGPLQAAWKRAPWLLGTMVIELGAALVIRHFDAVLQRVILLAAFMPIISAVSGNVGLQAAAITVRALDQSLSLKAGGAALLKEIATTLLMAVVCGLVLGAIGAAWSRHLLFGAVIGLALTCSMITAAFMGTLFPMVSKRLGFDPATTAGPFETAFQDVIGFGVFLGLATLLASHI